MIRCKFGILLLVHVLMAIPGVSPYSHTPVQYHIQTDKGPDRYFRFQTYNGQYRKEKRFEDGTVVGTYGWVDPNGYLLLFDYIADSGGYRIVREQKYKVKKVQPYVNSIPFQSTKGTEFKRRPSPSIQTPIPLKTVELVTATPVPTSTATEAVSPITTKPKLRPLFIKKKKRPVGGRFGDRRRENYLSTRQKVKSRDPLQTADIVDGSTVIRKPIRTKTIVRPHSGESLPQRTQSPAPQPPPSKSIPTFGYEDPGGRVTIDFDLGNQYRKEKIFPGGRVVGEIPDEFFNLL